VCVFECVSTTVTTTTTTSTAPLDVIYTHHTYIHAYIHTCVCVYTTTHTYMRTYPRSEILPVKMTVPGLSRKFLFLDSAKKQITCGVGFDTTRGHFNRENLREQIYAAGSWLRAREEC